MGKKFKTPVNKPLPKTFLWAFAMIVILALPLFYYKPAIDVTLTPKLIFLAVLLLMAYLVLLIRNSKYLPLREIFRQWPVIFWSGFILLSIISLFVAYNPWEGVFDIFRSGLSLLFLIVTIIILFLNKDVRPFIIASLFLAGIMIIIGLRQYFHFVFGSTDSEALYRINGLMSHKNVFSGVLFLLIPLLSYSILRGRKWEKIVAVVMIFFDFTMLFLLQTRSLWMAVLVSFVVVVGAAIIFSQIRAEFRSKLMRGRLILLAGAFVFSIVAGSLLTSYSLSIARSKPPVEKTPRTEITGLGERAASILDIKTENRQRRLEIWIYTGQMIQDYPLLGVGAGNWKILIPGYYDPDYQSTYYHNWRQPHNDFLQVWAEKGIVGLLFFLGFFVSLGLLSLRILRRSGDMDKALLVLLAIAGIAGFMVDAMFSFPIERIDEQMFLMFFAAIIVWAGIELKPGSTGAPGNTNIWIISAAIVFSFVSILLGRTWVRAEVLTNKAQMYNSQGKWQATIKAIDAGYSKLTQIDPVNNPMLYYRGKAYLNLNKLPQAEKDLDKSLEQTPYSFIVMGVRGFLYTKMGDYNQAIETHKKALSIYPIDRTNLRNMGLAYYYLGQYEEALFYLYQCLRGKDEDPQLNQLISEIHAKLNNSRLTD